MEGMEASPKSMWKSVERARAYAREEEAEHVRRMHVANLRERVQQHHYEIDAGQVADALLRRLQGAAAEREVRLRARSRSAGAPVHPA
jgi:anti-sigma28 factor (negative regulator of flagellin synthesis)